MGMQKIIEKKDDWFRIGDYSFVKNKAEKSYEVIRLVDADDLIHIEFYNDVNIKNLTKDDFKGGFGFEEFAYNEFIQSNNPLEKASIFATFVLWRDDNVTCYSVEELSNILKEVNVIQKEEKFELYCF